MMRRARLVLLSLALSVAAMAAGLNHQSPTNHLHLAKVDASMIGPLQEDQRVFRQEVSRSKPTTTTTTVAPTTTTVAVTTTTRPKPAPKPPAAKPQKTVTATAAPAPVPAPSSGGLPAGLLCIRHWESTDNYSDNTGNGFYGAYQYTVRTWNHYKGFARADLAPPNVQDERALSDYNRGPSQRHQNWPRTSRRCGV